MGKDTIGIQDGHNVGMESFNKFISKVKHRLLTRTCLPLVILLPVPCILVYSLYMYRLVGAISGMMFLVLAGVLLIIELVLLYVLYKRYSSITREKVYQYIDSEPRSESRFSSIVELELLLKEKSSAEYEAIKSYISVQAEKSLARLDIKNISWPSLRPLAGAMLVLAAILWSGLHTYERTAHIRQQYSKENSEIISKLEEILMSDASLSKELQEAGRELIEKLQHQSIDSRDVGESLKKVEDTFEKERARSEPESREEQDESEAISEEDQRKEQEKSPASGERSDDETRDQEKNQQRTEEQQDEIKPDKDGPEDKDEPHEQKTEKEDSREESKEPGEKKEEKESEDGEGKDTPEKTTPEEPAPDSDKENDQSASDSGVERKEQNLSGADSGEDSGEKQDMGEGAEGEGDGDDAPGASQGGEGSPQDLSEETSGSDSATTEQDIQGESSDGSEGNENQGDMKGDDGSQESESESSEEGGREERKESDESSQKLEDIISEMKEKRGEKGEDGAAEKSEHESNTDSGQESAPDGSGEKNADSSESDEDGAADQDGESGDSDTDSGGTRTSSRNDQTVSQDQETSDAAPERENLQVKEEFTNEEMEEFGDVESMSQPEDKKDPLSLDGYDFEEVNIESDRASEGGEGVVMDSVEQEGGSASSTMQIESTKFKKPQVGKTSEEQPVPLEYEKLMR
jgi:hypothetical protein